MLRDRFRFLSLLRHAGTGLLLSLIATGLRKTAAADPKDWVQKTPGQGAFTARKLVLAAIKDLVPESSRGLQEVSIEG